MTAIELASRIDHTLLRPEATWEDVQKLAAEARHHRFASVCVQPVFTERITRVLCGSGVRSCCVVGFPHGANKPTLKAIEATAAVKDGADEIDVVAHLPYLMACDVQAARAELMEIVRSARAARSNVVIKVIVESAAIVAGAADPERVIHCACQAVRESGCDFIKTSTGYHPAGGATVDAVRWMKEHAHRLGVKASGGIRDLHTARALLDAGADRLGLSAGVAILQELDGNTPATAAGAY